MSGGWIGKSGAPGGGVLQSGVFSLDEMNEARLREAWYGQDPYIGYVKALLHMDGTNGSTTFVDEKGNTVTAVGNAQISTAQSKFGGASGLFDGSGDGLKIPNTGNQFDVGASDFTVETFIYVSGGAGTDRVICSKRTASGNYQAFFFCVHSSSNKLRFFATTSGSGWEIDLNSTTTLPTSTWVHAAVSRQGSNWRLFQDGVLVASQTSTAAIATNTAALTVGSGDEASAGSSFNGNIDEFRMTVGVARYTANFTPPTAPFPNQ